MKHGSLFSGIGGFDLAAEWMGWENVFHCECIEEKRKLLKQHFPKSKSYGDITTTDFTIHRGDISVLSGGFPCQDLSISNQTKEGKKGLLGSRSGLWSEFHRAIKEIYPSFIVIENSPQLLRKGFERILHDLSESGYNAEWRCISASEIGMWHQRERVFIVAYANRFGLFSGSFFKGINTKGIKEGWSKLPTISIEAIGCSYPKLPEDLLLVDGVSEELAQIELAIHGYGNAIVPQIAHAIFKTIEKYESQINSK